VNDYGLSPGEVAAELRDLRAALEQEAALRAAMHSSLNARIVSAESELRQQLLREAEARDAVRADLTARIDRIETQGRTLAAQVERLDRELLALGAGSTAEPA
jgi:hypothetical protein